MPPDMIEYELTAPNGKTYVLPGPRGATQRQLEQELLRQHPEAAQGRVASRETAKAADQPVPKRTKWTDASVLARSLLQGGGDLLGMAVQGAPGMMGEYAKPQEQQISSKIGRGAEWLADKFGLEKPLTDDERLASSFVRGGASAVIPGGGARGLISSIIGGAGGGLASEYVRQKGGGTAAQIAAALTAGIGAPTALHVAGRGLGKAGSYVGNATERAANTLRSEATNPDAAARAIASRLSQQRTPGTAPTLGETASDTGLAALQRERMNTPIADQMAENMQRRVQNVDEAVPTVNVDAVQDLSTRVGRRKAAEVAAENARKEAARVAAIEQAQQEGKVSHIVAESEHELARDALEVERVAARTAGVEAVGPDVRRQVSGKNLRGDIVKGYKDIKAQVKAAYEAVGNRTVRVKDQFLDDLFNDVENYFGETSVEAKAELQKILKTIVAKSSAAKAGGKQVTSKLITNIDSHLADFAGRASRTGADEQAAFANQIRDRLDEHILSQLPPRMKVKYAHAKELRSKQGELFEGRENPLSQAVTKRYGRDVVSDVVLPVKLIKAEVEGGDAANRLIAAIGPDASETAVRQEVRRLIDDKKLTADNVVNFRELMERFPGVKQHIDELHEIDALYTGNVKKMEEAFKAKTGQITEENARRLEQVKKATEYKVLKDKFGQTHFGKLADPDKDTGEQIAALLNSNKGRPLRSLAKAVQKEGDPDAIAGLRRAIADHVTEVAKRGDVPDAAGNIIPASKATFKVVKKVLNNAEGILTPDQRKVFQMMEREMEGVRFAETRGVVKPTERTQFETPGVQSGMMARTLRFAMRMATNEGRMDKLIVDALRDPAYAATLLKRATPDRLWKIKEGLIYSSAGTGVSLNQVTDPALEGVE